MTHSRCARRLPRASSAILVACLATAGPAAAQVLHSKLIPAEPLIPDALIYGVEWLPGEAFLADIAEDSGVVNSGGINVYDEVGDGWQIRQVLKAPVIQTNSTFGYLVEASGEWLLTTAPFTSLAGTVVGSAHVFRRVDGTWVHHQTLLPHDAGAPGNQQFGLTADIDGATLIVGCWADNSAGTAYGGSAYVFELVGQSWTEIVKLVPEGQDLVQFSLFGSSVAVRGETVVVGASNHHGDGSAGSNHGAAFVFQRNGGAWNQTQKLVADDGHAYAAFGSTLALQGDSLLVGARGHDHSGSGQQWSAVYAFSLVAGTWTQTQELNAPMPGDPNLFGVDVDLDGNLAVIGAGGDADLGTQAGCAYLYRREGSQWELFGKALAPDGKMEDYLAEHVRIRGTRILLSAPGFEDENNWNTHNTGAGYVFDIAPRTWQYGSCFAVGPCGNGDDHGGCVNSDGQGAVLAAGGSTSVSEDALALEARWLPPDVLGILFLGGAEQSMPFGDGRMVVGPGAAGIFRILPPQSSGAQGAMLWDGGLVATSQSNPPAGQIVAGSTWYTQVWYRDPSGPCGSGYNTTNGLQIEFKP